MEKRMSKKMSESIEIRLKGEYIRLGQALKAAAIAQSGVDAKYMIQDGLVQVNGETETRRGRKLHTGDTVDCGEDQIHIIG